MDPSHWNVSFLPGTLTAPIEIHSPQKSSGSSLTIEDILIRHLEEMCENGAIAKFLTTPKCKMLIDGWHPRAKPEERLQVVFPHISDDLDSRIWESLNKYLPELSYQGASFTLRVSIVLAVTYFVLDTYLASHGHDWSFSFVSKLAGHTDHH